MEFFVFVEGERTILHGFSISSADCDMKVKEVIDKFSELVKEKDPSFSAEKFKVYLYDYTNPTDGKDPELIPDLSATLSSLKTQEFDLILSEQPPSGDALTENDSEPEVEDETKFEQLVRQGKMHYELKDYQRAFQIFQHAANLDKDSVVPIQNQIRIYLKAGRYKTAMQMAQSYMNKFPADRTLLQLYAKAHQLSGSHNEAISYFKRLFLLPPHTQESCDDVSCKIAKSLISMGSLDQAISLLQPIATNNPTNLKANILMARTLCIQGRLHDALHIVLQSFCIDPFNKASRDFIGQSIITENQADILRSQLSDGLQESKLLFIIGSILYEYGTNDIARSFLKDAIDLEPNDPSISLLYLLNTLCISNSCIQTLDSSMPFINMISKRNDVFSSISSKIDFIHLVDGFSPKLVFEGQELSPVQFADKEQIYHLDQLDIFWFFFVIQSVLFTNGYLSLARELGATLLPLVQPYTLTKTVINQEIPTFGLITSLSRSISLPLKSNRFLYFLGDSQCLPLSWRNVKVQGEERLIVPLFIDQLSIRQIYATKNNISTLYQHTLDRVPEGSDLVVCAGYVDCLERIESKLSWVKFENIQEGFANSASNFCDVINNLSLEKKLRIYVHPIPPTGSDVMLFARAFNDCLSSHFKTLSQENPNVFFLDFYNDLVVPGKRTETLKSEFIFDNFHMNPNYLSIFESSINKCIETKDYPK